MRSPVKNSNAKRILIDHHPQPENDFDVKISTIETSSTSELIYEFFIEHDGKELIDKKIAECLYTGIVTDTGSFSYSCNFEKTYLVIAELIKLGIDGENIHRLIYDTYSEDRMRLLGYCLSNKLRVFPELHTAYIHITKDELSRYNYKVGDTEGIVNFALAIQGISLAILLTERDNLIRLSFRSKGNFSVNNFARSYFEGGGHRNAAGGNSYLSMENTLIKLEELLKKHKSELKEIGGK
jgi:phosphoesterase RecJ-like protein